MLIDTKIEKEYVEGGVITRTITTDEVFTPNDVIRSRAVTVDEELQQLTEKVQEVSEKKQELVSDVEKLIDPTPEPVPAMPEPVEELLASVDNE